MEKVVLMSAVLMFRGKSDKGLQWYLVKQNDEENWDFPKTIARKGESSVRAAIRLMLEAAGVKAKVLDEAGRAGGATKVNGKAVTQRNLYYLMQYQGGGEELLQFTDAQWVDDKKILKTLKNKREKSMLEAAREALKEVEEHGIRRPDDA